MVSHADRSPLPRQVQLFATTRLVLPYYLALKDQQARRTAGEAPLPSDGAASAVDRSSRQFGSDGLRG